MSETGVAQKIDLGQSPIYYEKSAKAGRTKANVPLNRIYQFGVGVPIDRARAIIFMSLLQMLVMNLPESN
ncbi:hypothetical protein [Coxiella-like endosymbiont]|uniref:hypothetical protein n=1 Tax=Coxiella-like endosymbiont TaxID=1592897 RepID=UPI00272B08CD|nr:hypothetical protein [Coxiella-like endosymbiont]